MPSLTKAEQRLFNVLQDGRLHPFQELFDALDNDLNSAVVVRVHLFHMRKKLRPAGYDITSLKDGGTLRYQLVRLLASAYDGKR